MVEAPLVFGLASKVSLSGKWHEVKSSFDYDMVGIGVGNPVLLLREKKSTTRKDMGTSAANLGKERLTRAYKRSWSQ